MSIDLTQAWNALVAKGTMKNLFEDDSGRAIEAGVRMGALGPESYAIAVDTGVEICGPAELTRFASGMEMLFNPVGKLKPHTRPPKAGRQPDLKTEAAACPFGCQDADNPLSIRNRPSLAEVACPGLRWRAYPNVAPWEARGLLVWLPCQPDLDGGELPHLPQALEQSHLEDFLTVARSAEGMATFFNSLHGGASANHLHFQSVYCDRLLAAESADRAVRGSYTFLCNYPASGLVFPRDVPAQALWNPIEKIQSARYPLNLIGLSSGVYLFVRHPEHEILEEFPGRAFGAINLAGLFITSDAEERKRVTEQAIALAYGRLTIDRESLADLIGA